MADGSIAVEIDYLTWAEQTVIWCVIVIIVAIVSHQDESAAHICPVYLQ
jgi:hypothetical protein